MKYLLSFFFLNTRKLHTEHVTRQWFDYRLTETEALHKLKEKQLPAAQKIITAWAREQFLEFGQNEILATVKILRQHCNIEKFKDDIYIESILRENIGCERSKITMRPVIYKYELQFIDNNDGTAVSRKLNYEPCKPFILKREKFLSASEITELDNTDKNLVNEFSTESMPF
jgi:hypothetical protein